MPGVQVDAPAEAIFFKKVVIELGLDQLFLLEHIGGPDRNFIPLHERGNGIIELVVGLVLADVGRIHVDLDGFTKRRTFVVHTKLA